MLAATLALLLAAQPDTPVHWECSVGGVAQAEGFLGVTRQLRADGSFIADQLDWRPRSNDGQFVRIAWVFAGDASPQVRLDSLFGMFGLARPPMGRMWAIMRADGREVSRVRVDLPRLQARDGQGRVMVNLDYRNGPAVWTSDRPTAPTPALGEASDVDVLIEEERSDVLAQVRLPMPDWAGGRREVAMLREALGEVARDFRARCRNVRVPVRGPVIVLPGR